MSSDNMVKEMFSLFKSSTDAAWGTISTLQNQAERMANIMLDQSSNIQAEGRRHLGEWIANTRKTQEDLRKTYNEGLDMMPEMFEMDRPVHSAPKQ